MNASFCEKCCRRVLLNYWSWLCFCQFWKKQQHTPAFGKFSIYLNTFIFQDFFLFFSWFTNIVNFVCRRMSIMAGFYSKTKGKLYISLCIPSALMLWDFELVCLTVCQWQIKTLKLFFFKFVSVGTTIIWQTNSIVNVQKVLWLESVQNKMEFQVFNWSPVIYSYCAIYLVVELFMSLYDGAEGKEKWVN